VVVHELELRLTGVDALLKPGDDVIRFRELVVDRLAFEAVDLRERGRRDEARSDKCGSESEHGRPQGEGERWRAVEFIPTV
jgi:hypothetical protein